MRQDLDRRVEEKENEFRTYIINRSLNSLLVARNALGPNGVSAFGECVCVFAGVGESVCVHMCGITQMYHDAHSAFSSCCSQRARSQQRQRLRRVCVCACAGVEKSVGVYVCGIAHVKHDAQSPFSSRCSQCGGP